MLSINGVRLYSLKEFQNILEDSYNLSISKNTISKNQNFKMRNPCRQPSLPFRRFLHIFSNGL